MEQQNHNEPTLRDKIEFLTEQNEEALLADGLEDALIGVSYRCGQPPIAVYDYDKCISIFMDNDGMSFEEAVEYFEHNVVGAYVGTSTPCYVKMFSQLD